MTALRIMIMAMFAATSAVVVGIGSVLPLQPVFIWHAGLMIVAWTFLLPLGALMARFFKVMPGQDWPRVLDNKVWWHAHIWLQYAGVLLATAAMLLVVEAQGFSLSGTHARFGICALALGWGQIVSGLLRGTKGGPTGATMRGDHYDMTARRRMFEAVHKPVGWLSFAIAVAAVQTGLELAGAPAWLIVLAFGPSAIVLVAFAVFTRRGLRIDTYAAIWGPSPALPTDRSESAAAATRQRQRDPGR